MSRIRSVHPGLWTDEAFVSLTPFARLLLMGIWTECDDKGIFQWSPLQLKMRILPADNIDAGELLAELVATECVVKYEINGKFYGAVRNFAKFQRPKKPNDIHPATAEILAFAGHNAEPVTDDAPEVPNQLPTSGEKAPQMEDGEEDGVLEPNGSCASGDALKPEHIFEEWNNLAKRIGKPVARDLTPERRQLLRSRIAQYDIDDFVNVFGRIERSPFLRGDNGWRGCTFDWVLKKQNFQKILEGNYDN